MRKEFMTREQAVEVVGEAAVSNVDSKACDPTNRVGYNGLCQGDDSTEWSASVGCEDKDGNDCILIAYYYTSSEQEQVMIDNELDTDYLDFKIAGYEVI